MLVAKKPIRQQTLLRVSQDANFDGVFFVTIGKQQVIEVEVNDNISINTSCTEAEAALIKTVVQFFIDRRGY